MCIIRLAISYHSSMASKKYDQLNNEQWLRQQYEVMGKGTTQIAREIGAATGNSVRQALLRFGISIRNRSEAQTLGNDDVFIFDKDVILGSLLGDAGLRKSSNTTLTVPYFYKRNKYRDHVELIASKLYLRDWTTRIKPEKRTLNGKDLHYWLFTTPALSSLAGIYNDWYPNGKKVIPENIEPTPLMLHHWFLDDGSSYLRQRKTRQVVITLSSQCFSKDNQQMLCDKVNAKWVLGMLLNQPILEQGFELEYRNHTLMTSMN